MNTLFIASFPSYYSWSEPDGCSRIASDLVCFIFFVQFGSLFQAVVFERVLDSMTYGIVYYLHYSKVKKNSQAPLDGWIQAPA